MDDYLRIAHSPVEVTKVDHCDDFRREFEEVLINSRDDVKD